MPKKKNNSKILEIQRIEPVSVGKVFGAMYVIIGFLVGIALGIFWIFAGIIENEPGLLFIGFLSVLALPLLYGALGLVIGIVIAAIYNLIASKIGGLKIKLKS